MYSISHADFTASLRASCFRLGMFYTAKHVIRRIYNFVARNGKSTKDIISLEVLSDGKGAKETLYFRVYFADMCIETLNSYILHGKK